MNNIRWSAAGERRAAGRGTEEFVTNYPAEACCLAQDHLSLSLSRCLSHSFLLPPACGHFAILIFTILHGGHFFSIFCPSPISIGAVGPCASQSGFSVPKDLSV